MENVLKELEEMQEDFIEEVKSQLKKEVVFKVVDESPRLIDVDILPSFAIATIEKDVLDNLNKLYFSDMLKDIEIEQKVGDTEEYVSSRYANISFSYCATLKDLKYINNKLYLEYELWD